MILAVPDNTIKTYKWTRQHNNKREIPHGLQQYSNKSVVVFVLIQVWEYAEISSLLRPCAISDSFTAVIALLATLLLDCATFTEYRNEHAAPPATS